MGLFLLLFVLVPFRPLLKLPNGGGHHSPTDGAGQLRRGTADSKEETRGVRRGRGVRLRCRDVPHLDASQTACVPWMHTVRGDPKKGQRWHPSMGLAAR